jgi:ribosomal protein S15P/S13E
LENLSPNQYLKLFTQSDNPCNKEIQRLAEEKYKNAKLTTTGHSIGSIHAENATKGDIVTLNKPVKLSDYLKEKNPNQTDIRTQFDPVSILNNNVDITIKSKSLNPLYEHSTETLKDLPNKTVGSRINLIQKGKELLKYSDPKKSNLWQDYYTVKIQNY